MSNDEKVRQIGLFGGSFNPPHVGHTLATLWALQTHPLDEVWWIPTHQHAFSKGLVDFEHRRAMCELAVEPLVGVSVNDIERSMGGQSRTIDTVAALQARHPDTAFWLIVGADILGETERWKQWDELMTMVSLLVVGRVGFEHGQPAQDEPFRLPDVSSTIIREALSRCDYDALGPWVPRRVIDYIAEHALYVDPNCVGRASRAQGPT
ncbi:MAG: nicotinate (nicotinamide) nucleotide adenylyltransferase [Bradymonadaceae bacterium]|nr:nicotinate (nicotinamide) nucleotide adenylyltransferase [Lujinxingiaceae bacterium]